MLFAFSFSFTQYIVPAIILHMNISLNFLHVITPKQFNCYTQTCFSYVMIIFTASILPTAQEEPMNILFHRYGSICEPDIMEAFQSLNFTVIEEDLEISQKSIDGGQYPCRKDPDRKSCFCIQHQLFPLYIGNLSAITCTLCLPECGLSGAWAFFRHNPQQLQPDLFIWLQPISPNSRGKPRVYFPPAFGKQHRPLEQYHWPVSGNRTW